MKRRYKLLLIIVIGSILTILINSTSITSKIAIVALGDGFSLGMTPYNVAGTSFNDYLKEKYEAINNLESYNNEFSKSHLTSHELNEYLEKNLRGKYTKIPIKQIIASADIITIAVGLDELADKSLIQNISLEQIEDYSNEISKLLKQIREFYEKKILVIGLYPAYNLKKQDVIEINNNLKLICGKNNADFLDVLAISLKPEYYLEINSYYMNYKAHEEIAKIIYKMYKNNVDN